MVKKRFQSGLVCKRMLERSGQNEYHNKLTFSLARPLGSSRHLLWLDRIDQRFRDVTVGEMIRIGAFEPMQSRFIRHYSVDQKLDSYAVDRAVTARDLMLAAMSPDDTCWEQRPGQVTCEGLNREWVYASGIRFCNGEYNSAGGSQSEDLSAAKGALVEGFKMCRRADDPLAEGIKSMRLSK